MPVKRIELPQRRLRAHRLQLAMQLHLERPRKQHVSRHADDDCFRCDLRERGADALRIVAERRAVDRFAEQQKRAHRESFGEALAVIIEIFRDRRTLQSRHELAEAGVELVASAISQHAHLTRPAHTGGHVAAAQPVAHQLALQVPCGGAPAVRSKAGGNHNQLVALRGVTHGEGNADHAAKTGTDKRDRAVAPAPVEPRRNQIGKARRRNRRRLDVIVEAAPGGPVTRPARTEARCSSMDRSGPVRRATATTPRLLCLPSPPSPKGNGDAVMPPTITTAGAVPISGP